MPRRATPPAATPGETAITLPPERITGSILLIRGQRVLLDSGLAELYGVPTKVLLQAVRRNAERFPEDFMFQLSSEEFRSLRSQSVTSSSWGGRRYAPYAFTEQGVAMLSSVLNSPRAVQVNIEIMRAFVQLRGLLATHADLARKIEELEQRYDEQFRVVFDAIRELMAPPPPPTRRLGFATEREPPEAAG
ncbi:MAG: ORF6N domain-containing protein [Hyphomicrobiales bacterium]